MPAVGYVYDSLYLEHGVAGHPETPSRLQAIMSHLEESGVLAQMVAVQPRDATVAEIQRVHATEVIDRVRRLAKGGDGWLDPDTYVGDRSYDAAVRGRWWWWWPRWTVCWTVPYGRRSAW